MMDAPADCRIDVVVAVVCCLRQRHGLLFLMAILGLHPCKSMDWAVPSFEELHP
jgi:hypothetical protein